MLTRCKNGVGHSRSQEFVLGGLTTEAPKLRRPTQPTKGSGKYCKLPQRGPGQRKQVSVYLELEKHTATNMFF